MYIYGRASFPVLVIRNETPRNVVRDVMDCAEAFLFVFFALSVTKPILSLPLSL